MKVIVISIDALSSSDLEEHASLLPNIKRVIKDGTLIKNVETIMPTLTYPIHTTIITGEYPSVHGIDHNVLFEVDAKYEKWNWHYKYIKCRTIIDALKDEKRSVTTMFWPVTAGLKIDKCIPEIWDYKTGKAKGSLVFRYGSKRFLMTSPYKHRHLLDGKNMEKLDNFSKTVLSDLIDKDLSDLTLVHMISIDAAKHDYGINSKETLDAIQKVDNHIGHLYDKVKDNDDVTFVLVSDHSQIDSTKLIDINKIFKDNNLLFDDGCIAYPHTCDGSCYVYLPSMECYEQVKMKLEKIISVTAGLDKLYDLTEENNISKQASFLIGLEPGYAIGDKLLYIGQHGQDPKYGHNVFMACSGKNIKQNYVIDGGHVINHANTLAKMLDVNFVSENGECVNEIFKEI